MKYNKTGILFGLAANTLWGLLPLYWQLLKKANAFEIVSNRAVWSLVFCFIVLTFNKRSKTTLKLLLQKEVTIRLFVSAALISVNWIVYIWAANHDHVVEAALGYYINPLAMIALGVFFLHEKLTKLQWFAITIAAIGAVVLTIDYGHLPWVAVALALSWSLYGFVKKKLDLESLVGLALETLLAFPFYCGYLIYLQSNGANHLGDGFKLTTLLIGAGVVTAIPLLFFNGAATRVPYSVMGLFQYVTPTLMFIIGVWIRHENMPTARWFGFFIIWIALVALGYDLIRSGRSTYNRVTETD
jgi:chloramphenicol-sensitive protein RarD